MARKNHNAGTRNRERESLRRSERMHYDAKHRPFRKHDRHDEGEYVLGPLSEHLFRPVRHLVVVD